MHCELGTMDGIVAGYSSRSALITSSGTSLIRMAYGEMIADSTTRHW